MIGCSFENGNKARLRHVTVGALVINRDNKVLLVKRVKGLWNGDKYTIPGGFLDRDENFAKGVLRELFEETGLTGHKPMPFRINDSPSRPKEDRQNVDVIYIVDEVSGTVDPDKEVAAVTCFFGKAITER